MSLLEDYRKKKAEDASKENAKGSTVQSGSSLLDIYKDKKTYESFESGDAQKEINAVLGRYQNTLSSYYDTANKQLAQRDVYSYNPDAAQWNEQSNLAISGIEALKGDVYDVISKYEKHLDGDFIDQIYAGLDSDAKSYGDIAEAYKGQSDFYGSFADENAYNKWYEGYKESERIKSLDVDSATKELEALKKERGRYTNTSNIAATHLKALGRTNAVQRFRYEQALSDEEWLSANDPDGVLGLTIKDRPRNTAEATALHQKKVEALTAMAQGKTDEAKVRDYDDRINALERDITNAQRIQNGIALHNDAVNAEDFEKYVQEGIGLGDDVKFSFGGAGYKNDVVGVRNEAYTAPDGTKIVAPSTVYNHELEGKKQLYLNMTEEEVNIYSYYLAKYGKKKAEEYLDSITETVNNSIANKNFANLEGNTALELLFGVAAGLDQFASGIESLFSSADYIPQSATQMTSGMVREDLADDGFKTPKWMGGSSLGQMAYDSITTTSNMMPSILTSVVMNTFAPGVGSYVGSAMMGASAAGNAYADMVNLGYNKDQAKGYAALVGASEAILQSVIGGIGRLGASAAGKAIGGKVGGALTSGLTETILKNVDNAFARFAIKYGTSMIAEGGEEYLQEVLDTVFKNLVFNENNEVKIVSADAIYSGILGALSAYMLEGVSIAGGEYNVYKTGKTLQGIDGAVNRLAEIGKTFSADSVAYRLAGKVDGNTGAYTIGRLFMEEGAVLTEQNMSTIENALIEGGIDEKSAKTLAKTFARVVEGATLTDSQKAVLENCDPLTSAIRKSIIGENTTVYKRTQSYKQVYNDFVKVLDKKKQGKNTEATPAVAEKTEQTLGVRGEFTSNNDGKTTLKATGEEVSIKEIASIHDGDVVLALDSGKKVNARDVVFKSENEALVYEGLVNAGYSIPAINAIVRTYDGKTGATAFLLGVMEQYEYGALGFSQKDSDGVFSKDLDEVTKRTAFEAGRIDKNTDVKEQQEHIDRRVMQSLETGKEKSKGTVIYNGNRSALSKRQKASLKAIEELSRSLGVRFMVYDSKKVGDIYYMTDKYGNVLLDEEGKKVIAPNGMYDPKTKTVYIDVNAGNNGEGTILFTAAHELTHLIKEWSPAKYEVFKRFLLEKYGKRGISVEQLVASQIAKAKENGRDIDYDEALDEVVADSCESFLLDSQAIAELKQKDESLWKKIKEEITKFIDRIKQLYKGLDPNSEEGKIVRGWMDEANELRAMWVDALADAGESYSSIGIELDSSSASVAPFFSERTWTASEYVKSKNEMTSKLSEALGVSRTRAARYIDDVNSIAKIIAEDRARLDYEASSFGSAFVSNVEYGGSFDYTTLCKKRRLFTGTFSEIQKRLRNVALTPDDILKIRNLLIENGQEATCGLCYVEGSRANMGKFAKEFIRLYKKYNPDGWTPDMADVNTPDGVEQMRINHPEVYEQYEYFWNHYGKLKDSDPALFASQQKPKLYEARKEYKGEILEAFKNDQTVEKKNRNGGIRMQSFSDFEIVHLIDTMQVIMDMSTVGLAGQAYTKVPEFARAFGNTGLKINLSLIAKGVDENGRLIFDDREGMPHQTAFSLRNRFSKNVGTIIVTFTDEQLMAAMADERIDFIIPFHRSQWKKGQYSAMGLPKGTKDYTFMQNEKLIKPTYHEYRGRMVKDKATNFMPNEYWDFSKSGKENAELYLKMCAESNKRPKFYKLLENNGDGSYSLKNDGSTDGYWKLLIDFKMYDNKGKGSPQMAVRPEFEMDDAADMLREYKGGHGSYPVSYAVVDQFVSEYQELAEVAKRAVLQERSASLGQRGLREQEIVDYLEKASPKAAERYKNDLAELEKQKSVLADLKKQISKGKTTALQDEQIKTQNRISLLERRTAKAESSARLVMEKRTSLAKARDKAKMQDKKSALKKQIRDSVKRLDTLLNKGTKEKHVKSGQRGVVSSAIALYEVLFNDVVLNEDLVRYGGVRASEKESIRLSEYRDLLEKRDTVADAIEAFEKNPSLTKEDYKRLDELRKELRKIKQSILGKSADLKEYFERARAEYREKTAKSLVEDLQREYKKLKDSEDDFISNAYSAEVYERLEVFKNNLVQTSVRAMNEVQLSEVLDAFKMIEHSLKQANALFREGKAESLEEWLKETRSQLVENGKEGKDMPKFLKVSSDVGAGFFWNELKPYYAVERTGSDRIRTLFWDVIEGEQRAFTIEKQARDFLRESKKKHNITQKVLEQTKTFTLPDGKTFTLKVSDMMSIYAYSKREQANLHMLQGGFVFGNDNTYKKTADFIKKRTKKLSDEKVKEFLENVTALEYTRAVHQTPYVPGEELLKKVVGAISGNADYKGFADDLQNFMTDLGQLGNETSNKLYGVDLFKEKHYIPLRSAKDYMNHVAMEMGDTVTSATITNMGMTKQTVPNANNPIMLESLDQLFADHVSQMASYASLAVPVDNMRRVLTFTSKKQDIKNAQSMLALMESYMGSGAKKYFDQYLKDVNGNAVKATGYANPLMGLFGRAKKVQVAANLSVAIQQPSSILRATAEINPKYLLSSLGNVRLKSTWEELQKYAPIAITKEIGGFDVGSNGSGKRYILSDEYDTLKDKAKAVFKDSDYRDDLYMSLATLGDEYGWGVIWNAVKKEAADTTKLEVGSKDYFEHCKKRFTEIIVKTQVYDSVNARSGMMRSQNDAVKFATSFMGEPTVTVNMLMDSATKFQRADGAEKKKAGKAFAATVASVITSALVNNALKSVIYAMRDEDEDETLAEKYLQALGKNVGSDIDPLNWLPLARDLVSIAEGWSVDRPDMSLLGEVVTDSTDIVSKMMKDEDVTMKDILNLAGTFGNFAGIPAENVIKDVKAIANTVMRMFDGINQTDLEDAWGYFYKGLSGKDFSEDEMLYDALRDGDEERVDYYKRDFEERDVSFETKVKSAIKKQYVSGKISKDQVKDDLSSYLGYDPKKDEDEIFWIIREWDYSKTKKKDDEDYEKYADFYSAVKSGKDLKKTIKFYTDHGVEKQTLASNITREFKPLYKEMTNKERAAIKGYLLNAYVVLGYDRAKKSKDIDGWLNEDED